MGQVFSLEHEQNSSSPNKQALMLLVYEKNTLTPISFLDFIDHPVSYCSNPILMIEPFTGDLPQLVEGPEKKYSQVDLLRTVHQNYRITPYKFTTYCLWLLTSNTISKTLINEIIDFSRTFPFSEYSCLNGIDASSIFYDLKSVRSLSAALSPPTGSLRASSPTHPTAQLPGQPTTTLFLRRSTQRSRPCQLCTLQTTFMSTSSNSTDSENTVNDPTTVGVSTSYPNTNPCDFVDDGFYIGSELAAQDTDLLHKIGVTHVVNLNGFITNSTTSDGIVYYNVKMSDCVFEELNEDFWNAVEFTKRAINNGGTVFAHCRLGISRSAALGVAYLMEKKKLSYDAAFALVKTKRPAVNINQGFVTQLKEKEMMSKTVPFGRGKPPLLKIRL